MTNRIPAVDPDPAPTEWKYELVSNFRKDGIPAEWSADAPHAWGSEDQAIHIGSEPNGICFSHDDRFIAVWCKDSVEIYENNAKSAMHISVEPAPQAWSINHMEWIPKGGQKDCYQVIVCSDGRHDGSRLTERSAFTQIYILDLEHSRAIAEPKLSFHCLPWPLRCPDMLDASAENLLVRSHPRSDFLPPADTQVLSGQLEVWSISGPSIRYTLPIQSRSTVWLGYSPDYNIIGVATTDQILRLFNASSGALLHATGILGGHINSASFSPEGTKVACACTGVNKAVQIFGVDGSHLRTIAFEPFTRSLAWSPDGVVLAFGAQGGALQCFDFGLHEITQSWQLRYPGVRPSPLNEPTQLQFVDNGRILLFATGQEGGVETYNFKSNRKDRYEPTDESDFVRGKKRSAIAWSNTRRAVACFDGDGVLRFWNA